LRDREEIVVEEAAYDLETSLQVGAVEAYVVEAVERCFGCSGIAIGVAIGSTCRVAVA